MIEEGLGRKGLYWFLHATREIRVKRDQSRAGRFSGRLPFLISLGLLCGQTSYLCCLHRLAQRSTIYTPSFHNYTRKSTLISSSLGSVRATQRTRLICEIFWNSDDYRSDLAEITYVLGFAPCS